MDIKKVTDTLSVSPQIAVTDLPALAEAGFKSLICNRPDGEDNPQPSFDAVAEAARAAGLAVTHQPVVGGQMTQADVDAFGAWFDQAEKPVLAYCRSGTRSITLWALSRKGGMKPFDILKAADAAGYDLSGIAGNLQG